MQQWAPFAIAGAAIFGALFGAVVTLQVNRTRIQADERREFAKWLAEQRLKRYVEAHELQRDLVFLANGILRRRAGRTTAAMGETPERYHYGRWLSVTDQLRGNLAGLRILGAVEVAQHLEDTLNDWWSDDIRKLMREAGQDGPVWSSPEDVPETWRSNRGGRADWFLKRADEMVALARADVAALLPAHKVNGQHLLATDTERLNTQ